MADQTAEDTTPERWTFGGSRVSKGKRVHAWIDPTGRELWFSATGSYSPGAVYEVQVVRNGERVTLRGRPDFTGTKSADSDLHASIAAQHKAAELELQRRAREQKIKRDDPVEMAIEHLVRMAANIPPSQRLGFAAYVAGRVARGA